MSCDIIRKVNVEHTNYSWVENQLQILKLFLQTKGSNNNFIVSLIHIHTLKY